VNVWPADSGHGEGSARSGVLPSDETSGRGEHQLVNVRDLTWVGQRLADAGRADIRDRAPGLPTAELIVMYDLLDHGPSTITELTERTGYAQSHVSTSVAGLRGRGWAGIRPDPTDRRRTLVYIPTEVQRQAREVQARSAKAEILEPLLAGLPKRRREAIVRALDDLHNVLSAHETEVITAHHSTQEIKRLLNDESRVTSQIRS
jgi:MarR family transcriptional regulator, 2-MHQ and catechol-resistance regulon repressor